MRRTLGTAVFSGMLGVTLFGIFLTPVFFYVIDDGRHRADLRSRLAARIAARIRLGWVLLAGFLPANCWVRISASHPK